MTDKVQKIREEVERIQLYTQSEVLKQVLDYIDEVQKEHVNSDFEMALAEMIDKAQKCVVEPLVVAEQWKDELIKLAKSEEPVSEELEEAAGNYAFTMSGEDEVSKYYAFLAGAEWQKEQMMAKAVDGVITFDYYGNDNKTYGCIAHDSFCLEDIGLKDTDKVKMIIVKDEMS